MELKNQYNLIYSFFKNQFLTQEQWNRVMVFIATSSESRYTYIEHLDGTNIKTLPNNLYFRRGLSLTNTEIKELPDTLEVSGDLYLNDYITELPEGLSCFGEICFPEKNIHYFEKYNFEFKFYDTRMNEWVYFKGGESPIKYYSDASNEDD